MAKIEISLDTADKSKSNISIDGKALKNVSSVAIYSMDDPAYMGLEIIMFEKVGEDKGALRKSTRLSASAKTDWNMLEEDVSVDLKELAQVLLKREIK